MRIKKIRVRRFRSIKDLTVKTNSLSVFCGPNSCGKSNFFKAIQFAFKEDAYFTDDIIYKNIIASERDKQGAPLLSIWIDITFEESPRELKEYAGLEDGENLEYNFRAIRTGTITRKLGEKGPFDRDEDGEEILKELNKYFQVVYVPPIRDLTSGGMEPFQELLASALQRARGSKSLKSPRNDIEDILKEKASGLLSDHEEFARKTLGVSDLTLDTSDVSLDKMYKRVSLSVELDENRIPLSDIGTGHQSALIIHLFRQLGDQYYDADTLFLSEEPANHLHPNTTRSIGSDLTDISDTSQVFISTHSPILINYFGFDSLTPLRLDDQRNTTKRIPVTDDLSDGKMRSLFNHHGLKLTEPFLSRRVIVVEGSSDLTIISNLIRRRLGCTPDQADILIVQAGGKHHVVEISSYLDRLDTDWKAVFDWDVVINGDERVTKEDISDEEKESGKQSISTLYKLLNNSNRSNGFKKQLSEIHNELIGNAPDNTLYKNSKIHRFLEKDNNLATITEGDKKNLVNHLDSKHVSKYQPIMNKYNAWVWRKDIEAALLFKDEAPNIAENSLIESGELNNKVARNDNWEQVIHNKIHNTGNPLALRKLVNDLDESGMFAQTQINKAVKWLLEDFRIL